MRNNLKEKSKTLIGITLKTINHNAIKVFFPNFCQNYAELKKLASNHTLPMIAINHKIQDELGKYEKTLMKELAKKYPHLGNLNRNNDHFGTSYFKKQPRGCGQVKRGKYQGRFFCPFTNRDLYKRNNIDEYVLQVSNFA